MAEIQLIFVKVCPFCGAAPKVFGGKEIMIICEWTNCDIHPSVAAGTLDEALDSWNKRWTDKLQQIQVKI